MIGLHLDLTTACVTAGDVTGFILSREGGAWLARDQEGAIIPGTRRGSWMASLTVVREQWLGALHLAIVMPVIEEGRL